MANCYMSIARAKTNSQLNASYRHNFRLEEVPNADRAKQGLNRELVPLAKKTTARPLRNASQNARSPLAKTL